VICLQVCLEGGQKTAHQSSRGEGETGRTGGASADSGPHSASKLHQRTHEPVFGEDGGGKRTVPG